eukprot:ANDGO_04703.mRNA.1 hypothetical protein
MSRLVYLFVLCLTLGFVLVSAQQTEKKEASSATPALYERSDPEKNVHLSTLLAGSATYTKASLLILICGRAGCGGAYIGGKVRDYSNQTVLCSGSNVTVASFTFVGASYTDANINYGSGSATVSLGNVLENRVVATFATYANGRYTQDWELNPANLAWVTVEIKASSTAQAFFVGPSAELCSDNKDRSGTVQFAGDVHFVVLLCLVSGLLL